MFFHIFFSYFNWFFFLFFINLFFICPFFQLSSWYFSNYLILFYSSFFPVELLKIATICYVSHFTNAIIVIKIHCTIAPEMQSRITKRYKKQVTKVKGEERKKRLNYLMCNIFHTKKHAEFFFRDMLVACKFIPTIYIVVLVTPPPPPAWAEK